jgi:hypothetical protein
VMPAHSIVLTVHHTSARAITDTSATVP